jgi:hypothetical protein
MAASRRGDVALALTLFMATTSGRLPAPGSTRAPHRRLARLLISAAGLALLAYLVWRTGVGQLVQVFRRLGPGTCGLVVGLGLIELLLDCEALRRAMRGRISLLWTVACQSAGGLVNTAVPFEGGELVKATLLRKRTTDTAVLSGLVVWNYVWKLAKPLAVAACLVAGVLLGNVFDPDLRGPVAGGVALSFLPYLALRALLRRRPAERLMRLVTRHPRLERRAVGWIEGATRLDSEVQSFWEQHPRAYLQTFLLTFGTRFVGVLVLVVFAHSLGLPTDAGSILFLYATGSVVDYAAMLLPARLGVGEGTAYLVFQLMGLDPAAALVMSLTSRARSLLLQGPLTIWAISSRATGSRGGGSRDEEPHRSLLGGGSPPG